MANIAFVKHGNEIGNVKSSRSGCQESFSWHFQSSGPSHDKWKALRRSQSTRESGRTEWFQTWIGEMRGASKSLTWSSLTTGSPTPSYSRGSASVLLQKSRRRERDEEDRDWSCTYSNHWEGKEAWGLYCAPSNSSNQVIPADRAPSLSGCLVALPTCAPVTEILSVQFPPQPLLSVGACHTSVYLTRTQFHTSGTLGGQAGLVSWIIIGQLTPLLLLLICRVQTTNAKH